MTIAGIKQNWTDMYSSVQEGACKEYMTVAGIKQNYTDMCRSVQESDCRNMIVKTTDSRH